MENIGNEIDGQLYLTIQEAAEALLMSQSSVYAWIEKGRLEVEDLPSGKIIVISKEEAEKIKTINAKSKRNKASRQNQCIGAEFVKSSRNDQNFPEFSSDFQPNMETRAPEGIPDFSSKLQDSLELAKLISELSTKAGKYELLSDLQREQRENAEFWKNEYFRLQSENNELSAQNLLLKKELERSRRGILGLFSRSKSEGK